jgi:murein DD-endopeptidase MepM/ murein hydrolase activator NlpD
MQPEIYAIFVASNRRGTMRRITVPSYALHLLTVLAIIGGTSITAAVGSYARLVWKVANYNALARKQDNLQQQYQQLQTTVKDADQRLSSLQSLAAEVAVSYGFTHLQSSPLKMEGLLHKPDAAFENSVAEFNFLQKNASAIGLANSVLSPVSIRGSALSDSFTPTLWPVIGQITAYFGERLDPFSGEGAFHTGVDISGQYGAPVRATADGVVIEAGEHAGYGRLLEIDHGFGVTTYYAHLSTFAAPVGVQVKRGDVIGYVGVSGRTTGPHVHYEIRINDTPVNPMRYLRSSSVAD